MFSHNILVVDDEPLLQYVVKQKFRKKISAGEYGFTFASNGAKALEKIKSDHPIDMVLTDLRMPIMDGLALLEALKETDDELQAVVVSAYGDLKNIRAAMNRGAFDFLTKPVDLEDLEITIKKTLDHAAKIKRRQKEIQKAQEEISYLVFHDSLTKLRNRAWIISQLDHVIKVGQRYKDYRYALLFLDLDRFKLINDSLGHNIGDRVLQYIAHLLQQCARTSDTVARIGGDEFTILLDPIKGNSEIIKVVQRIHTALKEPFMLEGHSIPLATSIGIATGANNYLLPEDALRDADLAMYYAKDKKLDCAFFDPDMQARVSERLSLEINLRQALKEDQFYNYYQPIVSLATGELVGFEVLLRWQHPRIGWIPPIKFIPIAEETSLINPIGWKVAKETCRQLSVWKNKYPQVPLLLCINVSTIQLKRPGFIEQLEQMLTDYGLSEGLLKIEITESCLLEEDLTQQLAALKNSPFQLCIDDFGTGYSSLSRLHEFPIGTLKVDCSFVRKMNDDKKHIATVQMILSLADSLGMTVIAEGIETEKELAILKELGCELGQGYLFAKPLDHKAASAFIEAQMSLSEG